MRNHRPSQRQHASPWEGRTSSLCPLPAARMTTAIGVSVISGIWFVSVHADHPQLWRGKCHTGLNRTKSRIVPDCYGFIRRPPYQRPAHHHPSRARTRWANPLPQGVVSSSRTGTRPAASPTCDNQTSTVKSCSRFRSGLNPAMRLKVSLQPSARRKKGHKRSASDRGAKVRSYWHRKRRRPS